MPIYEQTYRRHEGRRPLRRVRAWPIAREILRLHLQRRGFLALMGFCWLPCFLRVIQVYVVTRFPDVGRMLPVDGRLFGEFLNGQIFLALVATVMVGAGLVANDLRTGAVLVYLSRPLTRRDYVLGKLGALLAVNLFVTLLPGLGLYAAALSLAPDTFQHWRLLWIGPAIVLQACIIALCLSLLALAVSALSGSARVAGLALFGLVVASDLVLFILRRMLQAPAVGALSVWADLKATAAALFDVQLRGLQPAWWQAAPVLALLAVASLWVLHSRVRAVEIVR